MIIKRKHGYWILALKEGEYLTDTLTGIPLKFRTKEAAEKTLDKILAVLQGFRDAEETLEPGFFTTSRIHNRIVKIYCKNPNNRFIRKNPYYVKYYLEQRYKTYPLNKGLLQGPCPKKHEFEFILEPTVFIKIPDSAKDLLFISNKDIYSSIIKRQQAKDLLSFRKILYTDPWQELQGY